MISRIRFDLNENNSPVIKVDYRPSEDIRDKVVKKFIELFGHTSMFCSVTFESSDIGNVEQTLTISPIPSDKLSQTADIIKHLVP